MHLQGVLVEDRKKDTILSAGEITVNITDWFFLKKNIELTYIGLKDAYINLQRNDAVWRHQFLLDYFTTPGSTKRKKENAISIAFKEINLQNIRVKQRDGWLGQDMSISLASLITDTRNVNFDKKIIDVNTLSINKPYFALRNYKGAQPLDTSEIAPPIVIADSLELDWNANKWSIRADKVSLRDGTFKNDNDARPIDHTAFDGMHIEFAKIYADFTNVLWRMDTITTELNLSTRERSGFEVKHLMAHAKFTPKEMTFKNLDIRTNNSYIRNYFSMKFPSFEAMSNFIDEVKMEGNFYNTDISSDDIAFFAPALTTWKKQITLNGKITGPVSALIGRSLQIQAGPNTSFTGNANLNGLPDIDNTFMDIEAAPLKTTYKDAIAFAPALKKITNPDLAQLQYIHFTGNFAGFIKDFVTSGTIQTALGNVVADVNMKIPSTRSPIYSGTVTTNNFNIGRLIKEPKLGYVSLQAKLKGAGFDPQKDNIAIESNIRYIDFNKYRYQNIHANGEVSKNVFDGTVKINDPNAAFTLNGLINYSREVPKFDFLADIKTIHFKALNLTDDDLSFTGKINANFTGKNIDGFLGSATISEAMIRNNQQSLPIDSLSLTSAIIDGQKHLNAYSNEFTAGLAGNFNISELPNSFKAFLSRYYPSYIKAPLTAPRNQVFTFDIKTHYIEEYVHLIDSSLNGFNNSHITGSINTITNDLNVDAIVPFFKYRQYGFTDVGIKATGNYETLALSGNTSNITIGDSLNIPFATFDIVAQNDISNVKVYSGGNSTIDRANLNAIVRTYNDGVNITFEPSGFTINGKMWTIENKGELEFRKNSPAHGQLVLREGQQEIVIRTLPSDVGNWNDIFIHLKNLNLGDISPYILPKNRLEGEATATVILENPGNKMRITSNNFIGRSIRFDNDSLGDVSASFVFDMFTQELTVKGKTLNPRNKDLAFDIHLYLKDAESQQKNIIALNANSFDLKYLNRFLDLLFSDITGEVTGRFDVKGPLDALYVVGKGRLQNAGLKINFTQCYYAIENREIELTEKEINLNGIVLRDTVTNHPIYLRGSILHEAFDNMFFDVTVSTRKPGTTDAGNNKPVQVLRTTYKDNRLFYGDVKGTGSFVLIGPANNTYMKIDAIASDENEGSFTIASADSRAGKMPEWLVERKFGTEMADSLYKSTTENNMTYELDITANPKVKMKFVMDDLTGDEITGRGYGTLNIKAGTREPLSIRGRYDIEEGTYNFTFQSFFKKPFEIIKGTENFISWNGSPTDATINFNAMYRAERVSFSPLAAASDIDASYANTRENVFVTARLSGNLFKPDFKFGIELDPNSRYNNDFNVSNALQQIQRRQEEVTRQVTYLIVFNSFAPPETGVASAAGEFGSAVNELGYSTISSLSGIFFNEINKKLNNELAKLLGSKVSVVFSGSVYNRNILSSNTGFNINQANVSGALRVPLFNNRFVISLGSSMEVPLQNSLQQTVQFLPDVTAEWMLNQSGTIRLNLFYRENLDFLTTSTGAAKLKRAGGGISFKKEFDNLREVFTNVKKRTLREMQSVQAQSIKDTLPKVPHIINPGTEQKPLKPTVVPATP